jgi:hypothetical protein
MAQAGTDSQIDLGELTKYAAASGGVAYAVGMITISIYLHQLGITDFSLAKPKLILTGVVVLLTFLLLMLFPLFIARRILVRTEAISLPKGTVLLSLVPLIALIAASSYLGFREPKLGQVAVWEVWEVLNVQRQNVLTDSVATFIIAAMVYLPICFAAVSACAAEQLFKRAKLGTNGHETFSSLVHFSIVFAIAVFSMIVYIYIFSLTFYPAISPAFGGGNPYYQLFVVTDEERHQWQELGIPFVDEVSNITCSLPVLHDSDTVVAVWLKGGAGRWKPFVAELAKSQISAVRMAASSGETLRPNVGCADAPTSSAPKKP